MQGNAIGGALRQRQAAYILGQGVCKTLFIHAGLPLQLMLDVMQQSSSSEPDRIVDKLNTLVQGVAFTPCVSWGNVYEPLLLMQQRVGLTQNAQAVLCLQTCMHDNSGSMQASSELHL